MLKARGPIWLGLTERVHSIRPYPDIEDIRRMVARSAYAQLHYSPLLLAGTVAGMALTYLAPPLLALFASGTAQILGPRGLGADGVRVPADAASLPPIAAVGTGAAGDRAVLHAVHARFRPPICPREGRTMEGPRTGRRSDHDGTPPTLRSGKGHRDENFPVASRLIHPRHRGAILAFYEFVRVADDIADHASLSPAEKLELLDRCEATLLGQRRRESGGGGAARRIARAQPVAPARPGPLTAFRMDVTKLRYRDWDDLIGYCTLLGHAGRAFRARRAWREPATWPANDALCAALQIINHLQDCGDDYRKLNRVYIPLDALAAGGIGVEELGGDERLAGAAALPCRRSPSGPACCSHESEAFCRRIEDFRLASEVAVIQSLAAASWRC